MVDAMTVLGAAATAKLAGDRLVRDLIAYIRETTSAMQFTSQACTNPSNKRPTRRPRKGDRLSRPMKPTTSGLGRRPSSHRNSKKVSTMTDAELEAELDARRRRRAKERDAYSRAMRSDKLAALEHELDSLRREIGRLDAPNPALSVTARPAGTPPNARWEPLPRSRRPPSYGSATSFPHQAGVPAAVPINAPLPAAKAGGPPPPPPPPPMPPMAGDDDDSMAIDPEKQKREKLERQKRREAKKKEREQNQKKMTLADIIRSAGPDPIRRLKPMTKKPADQEKEDWEKAKREREDREARQEAERIEKERRAKEGSKRASEILKKDESNNEEKDPERKKSEQKKGDEEDSNEKSLSKEEEGEKKRSTDQASGEDTAGKEDRNAKATARLSKSSTNDDNDSHGKYASEKKDDPTEGKGDGSGSVNGKSRETVGKSDGEASQISDAAKELSQQPKEEVDLGSGIENIAPNATPLPPRSTVESKKANVTENSTINKVSAKVEASS